MYVIASKRVGRYKTGERMRVSGAEAKAMIALGLASLEPVAPPKPAPVPQIKQQYARKDMKAAAPVPAPAKVAVPAWGSTYQTKDTKSDA